MTQVQNIKAADPNLDTYPNLVAHRESGGELKISAQGGLWYVLVIGGTEVNGHKASVQFASSDLAYALRQADGVARDWVLG